MKSQKIFWTSILLLAVLALGGCAQLATQKKAPLTAEQKEEQERERREHRTAGE